uniref:Uncharacterized protein n=1 Tax=Pavo cristatus TaxID=9049 RepID=A0A8C9FY44_PAVCR
MASRERSAAARQRGDKTRTLSAARPDAVPGRLCETQWLSVLAAEERDDVVGDVVAELLGAVVERCFQAELARRCVPFAVDQARAELLQAAAWRFLVRDEGDAALEAMGAWQEDEEPPPCATDAWAEGAVPVLPVCSAPGHGEVMPPPPSALWVSVLLARGAGWGSQITPMGHHSLPLSSPALPFPREAAGCALCPQPHCCPCALPRSPAPTRTLFHPKLKVAVCHRLPPHRRCRTRCSMLPSPPRENQAAPLCQSPRSEVRACDRRSTAPGTAQLDLPARWIQPQVEVLDPGAEPKRQPRPLRHRREPRGPSGRDLGPGGSWPPRGLAAVGAPRLLPPILGARQPSSSQSPVLGSLLGSVQLAPGVTIRPGGSEGPRLCLPVRREDAEEETGEAKRDLRPLRPTVPFPAIQSPTPPGCGSECGVGCELPLLGASPVPSLPWGIVVPPLLAVGMVDAGCQPAAFGSPRRTEVQECLGSAHKHQEAPCRTGLLRGWPSHSHIRPRPVVSGGIWVSLGPLSNCKGKRRRERKRWRGREVSRPGPSVRPADGGVWCRELPRLACAPLYWPPFLGFGTLL